MNEFYVFTAAFVIGTAAGLRSFTAPAAAGLAAYFGRLGLDGTSLGFMGTAAAAALFSLFAVFEYIYDVLPAAGKRTSAGPLAARVATGGLSGACVSLSAGASVTSGAIAGGIGGIAGAFAGYNVRRDIVRLSGVKDSYVGIAEDLAAAGLAVLAVAMV